MINCIWVVESKGQQESDPWVISGIDMYRRKQDAIEAARDERSWYHRTQEYRFRVRKYTPESSD